MINYNFSSSRSSRSNLDIPLVLSMFCLIIVGICFIYSAGKHNYNLERSPYIQQLIFLIPGTFLFLFFFFVNYQKLSNYSSIYYSIFILLLVLVFLLGRKVHGAKSWFSIAGLFSFQPSEIAKLVLIFMIAQYLYKSKFDHYNYYRYFFALLFPLPIITLVLFQPDPGTALVYIPIALVMLVVAGARLTFIASILLVFFLSFFFTLSHDYYLKQYQPHIQNNQFQKLNQNYPWYSFLFSQNDIKSFQISLQSIEQTSSKLTQKNYQKKQAFKSFLLSAQSKIAILALLITLCFFFLSKFSKIKILPFVTRTSSTITLALFLSILFSLIIKPYHSQRLLSFIDLEKDPLGISYNQRQSIIAIGSGGIYGHGISNGPQNSLNYIPENTTDFIFAVIGEELGFLRGTILIFLLYSVIIYRGFLIAYESKDLLGSLIASGITTMFFSHIFINLGMALGILPVMGIPLPFISYGGSSLVTNIISVALLLNISKRRFVY